eukprot:1112288-Pelagomonas_calceolata.AAC.4
MPADAGRWLACALPGTSDAGPSAGGCKLLLHVKTFNTNQSLFPLEKVAIRNVHGVGMHPPLLCV